MRELRPTPLRRFQRPQRLLLEGRHLHRRRNQLERPPAQRLENRRRVSAAEDRWVREVRRGASESRDALWSAARGSAAMKGSIVVELRVRFFGSSGLQSADLAPRTPERFASCENPLPPQSWAIRWADLAPKTLSEPEHRDKSS
jgi:acyl carrier protein phosphodiesterase